MAVIGCHWPKPKPSLVKLKMPLNVQRHLLFILFEAQASAIRLF